MTKYRILPQNTFIADLYLQFYHNGSWRFIPKFLDGYVMGKYLTLEDSPEQLPAHEEGRFMHASHDQEAYELIPFSKKYDNIQIYFDSIIIKRKEYLNKKKKQEEDAKIIYL